VGLRDHTVPQPHPPTARRKRLRRCSIQQRSICLSGLDHNRRSGRTRACYGLRLATLSRATRCARWKPLRQTLAAYPALMPVVDLYAGGQTRTGGTDVAR
jgi:hypothetical protein